VIGNKSFDVFDVTTLMSQLDDAVHFIAVDLLGTRFTIRANFKRWTVAICLYDLSCRRVPNSCKFGPNISDAIILIHFDTYNF